MLSVTWRATGDRLAVEVGEPKSVDDIILLRNQGQGMQEVRRIMGSNPVFAGESLLYLRPEHGVHSVSFADGAEKGWKMPAIHGLAGSADRIYLIDRNNPTEQIRS